MKKKKSDLKSRDDRFKKLENPIETNLENLNRALIVSRFGLKTPPTHLLLAMNNDIGQGKLLSLNNKALKFELTSELFSVPLERLDKVVNVENSNELEGDILNYDFKAQARLYLIDGSILDFLVKESNNGFLYGESKIYGKLAIPITAIQKINLGGFESDTFESKYDEWIIRSAKEFKKN